GAAARGRPRSVAPRRCGQGTATGLRGGAFGVGSAPGGAGVPERRRARRAEGRSADEPSEGVAGLLTAPGRPLARLARGCYRSLVFGIGPTELLVVAVLALLLFSPKELPKILR